MGDRIYYPCQQVSVKNDGAASYRVIHGAQQASSTTNFQNRQVYSLGQADIYQNVEDIPEVDFTISKVLDGYPLVYHEATIGATAGPSLLNRSTSKCLIALGIFSDTANSASGNPYSNVEMSGMFVTSVRYNMPLDGNFTEEVSFQGNERIWANDSNVLQTNLWTGAGTLTSHTGQFATADAPAGTSGVNARQHMVFSYSGAVGVDSNNAVRDPDATILPQDIWGISPSGTNDESGGKYNAHVGNVSISCSMNREPKYEQGRRNPYTRVLTLPVETTCEITVAATSGDMVSATSQGILNASSGNCVKNFNQKDRTIRIATCEGTRIYLGKKNRLRTVSQSGGDAGGGDVELTYSYVTYNDFTVMHSGDPNSNGATWWAARATYLAPA